MPEMIAVSVWLAVAAYCAVGVCILLFLLAGGFARIDRNAAIAPLHVKLLLAPGLIVLWPIILRRLFGARAPEDAS
jgi:hypothetical protein